jgi:diguanylate cyclase (GGDEF)-like protein
MHASATRPHLSDDERRRASECSLIPLHTIDEVQSVGMILRVAPVSGVITAVSANRAQWLGLTLDRAHPDLPRAVSEGATGEAGIVLDGAAHHVAVHTHPDYLLVEIEPAADDAGATVAGALDAIHRLSSITDPDQLVHAAAAELKALTGFDRVVVYRFLDDGRGIIIADDHEPGMDSYAGLHFPASDIPAQARALYTTKLSRSIVDATAPVAPLRYLHGDADPVDLTGTDLRVPATHHLEFMHHMGQVATLSLSMVDQGRLTGMITCSHRGPHHIARPVRRQLEVVARLLAARLESTRRIARLERQISLRLRRAEFVAPFYGTAELAGVMDDAMAMLREMVPCDGVYLRIGDEERSEGAVPPRDGIGAAITVLPQGPMVTDSLATEYPEAYEAMPGTAGLIAIPLGQRGDVLAFFRGEAERDVHWLGEQSRANRATPVSPRRDFTLWREVVAGRSLPWDRAAEEALDLGEDIRAALTARKNAHLAELARYDTLTGLPNRRHLEEIGERLSPARRARVAAIFLDLDDFKNINDANGHDVGDAVLAALGRRIAGVTRARDLAARLAGDEFVVLCRDVDPAEASTIAARLVDTLREPVEVPCGVFTVGVSAGVAMGSDSESFDDLLRAADQAMYRAKRDGRDVEHA